MKLILPFTTAFLFFMSSIIASPKPDFSNQKIAKYIEKYSYYAVKTMHAYNIPASITLAQGMLESDYGNSDLAQSSKNHFGIKCHTQWSGDSTYYDDDEEQECFRVYESVYDSFRDHGEFILNRKWYKPLFHLSVYDYESWAQGLNQYGYATDPEYHLKLVDIIERYKLYQLDYM